MLGRHIELRFACFNDSKVFLPEIFVDIVDSYRPIRQVLVKIK